MYGYALARAYAHLNVAFCNFSIRWQVVDYYLKRCTANVHIIEKFNIIERTCEFAKLYGILFSSVLTRGTQVCMNCTV